MQSIVLTGGPKAGKQRVAQALARRHPGIRVVQDGARVLLDGGFPVSGLSTPAAQVAFQRAVAAVRLELESLGAAEAVCTGSRLTLCLGGILDGAAHLTGGVPELCALIGIRPAFAYRRYAAVIHLESPATGDPRSLRFERGAEGILSRWREAELAVRAVWRPHPSWLFVGYQRSLGETTQAVERLLDAMDLEKAA